MLSNFLASEIKAEQQHKASYLFLLVIDSSSKFCDLAKRLLIRQITYNEFLFSLIRLKARLQSQDLLQA